MMYRFLADAILIVHLAFVAYVVLGSLLVVRWRTSAWLHVPAACWGVVVQFAGWTCPLTPLENQMRSLGGQRGYAGGFLQYYLLTLLYPAGLTRVAQLALGALVLAVNLAAYGYLVATTSHRQAQRSVAT